MLDLDAVLLVGHLLQPCDGLAVTGAGQRNVRHRGSRRGAAPIPNAGRVPTHITSPDLLNRLTPLLGAADAVGHDQALPGRMGVPRRPGTRSEHDVPAAVR